MVSDMEIHDQALEPLVSATIEYSKQYPEKIESFHSNNDIIVQGDIGTELFLILSGSVNIIVNNGRSLVSHGVRNAYSFVGEYGFLNHNVPRSATVRTVSGGVVVARLNRGDVFKIIGNDQEIENAAKKLWDLGQVRQEESRSINTGSTFVEVDLISALIGDIHGFSKLSSSVNSEFVDRFLFDFIEDCCEIAEDYSATFEDQGDGFKVVFRGERLAEEAVEYARVVARVFSKLRDSWSVRDAGFHNIGFGVGVVTDYMSIRSRFSRHKHSRRVISHHINTAAALSKMRSNTSDISIYIDEASLNKQKSTDSIPANPLNFDVDGLGFGKKYFDVTPLGQSSRKVGKADAPPDKKREHFNVSRKIFLCHNSEDKTRVRSINDALNMAGVETWFDERDIAPGAVWQRELEKQIQSVFGCLIMVGDSGIGPWEDLEEQAFINEFVKRKCLIIPVLIGGPDKFETPELPLILRQFQWVNLRRDPAIGMIRIVREIEQRLLAHRLGE